MVLSRSVAGRRAVVTGAAGGMGAAIAELFRAEGADVLATDRVAGDGITVLDVTDDAAVARVVGEAGPVDILVNCAGVSVPAPIDADGYWDAWRLTLDVNLTGYVRTIRACLPSLVRNGDGRIVNIASTEGLGATRTCRRTPPARPEFVWGTDRRIRGVGSVAALPSAA